MENSTNYGNYKVIQEVACTASLHGKHHLYSLAALNILLSITALLGNILIFIALRREKSLHPPSKLLFRCLTATDLAVGVVSQPIFAIQLISIAHQRLHLCYTVVSLNEIAGNSFSGVSLWTLTAISVDRLLALLLGLRYRHTVTLKRMRGIVICFWIFNITICSLRRFGKHAIISRVISAFIHSLLAISLFCYMKIYLTLRRHRTAVGDHAHRGQLRQGRMSPNMARYRKTVSTALWVQLTLVACYLPYGIVAGASHIMRYSPSHNLAVRLAITLVYLNSSLNPGLYCWKIRGVRHAVRETVRNLCRFNYS